MAEYIDVGLSTRREADPETPPTLPADAYPKVILDQREMFGKFDRAGVEEHWAEFLEMRGITPHNDDRELVPYVSKSRWVADCPECGGGVALWDENPRACCLNCGAVYTQIAWQPPTVRAEASRLLAAREHRHRDWFPHKGETTHRLETENLVIFGVKTEWRNNLRMPEGMSIPDHVLTPGDYLDHLRTVERKQFQGLL